MKRDLAVSVQGKKLFKNWLAPLVNLEYTLLLFATCIFHYHYFGEGHGIADLFAFDKILLVVVYVYGAIVLLASLIKIPADWQSFVAFMTFIGSALISVIYTALFWMSPSPSWQELLAQMVYVLQGVLSLIQVILLLTQKEGQQLAIAPRLGGVPTTFKSMAILAYAVGMTLLLHRHFSVAPDAVTAQVNLYGAILLEILARLTRQRHEHVPDTL